MPRHMRRSLGGRDIHLAHTDPFARTGCFERHPGRAHGNRSPLNAARSPRSRDAETSQLSPFDTPNARRLRAASSLPVNPK